MAGGSRYRHTGLAVVSVSGGRMASRPHSAVGSDELDGTASARGGSSGGSISPQLAALPDAVETRLDAAGRSALVLRAGPGSRGARRICAVPGIRAIARGFYSGRLPVRARGLYREQ